MGEVDSQQKASKVREIPDPFEAISSERLEMIPAGRPDIGVIINTDELSGLCPVEYKDGHGVRDFYDITIAYEPGDGGMSVELKSLKLYFEQFQDVPISHEDVAAVVYAHLEDLLDPAWLYVRNEPNIRGGITTTVELGEVPADRELNPLGMEHHDAR